MVFKRIGMSEPQEWKNETTTDVVDLSLLDFMTMDEFLLYLKGRTEANNNALWDSAVALAGQLKGSRALLSLGPYLSSNDGIMKVFDRLLDTAYVILKAEHVFLLQLDVDQTNFTVTHSRTDAAIGMRMGVASGKRSLYFQCH